MSKLTDSLRSGDWRRVARLTGELAEIPPHRLVDSVRHLMGELQGMVGANSSFVVMATRGLYAPGDPLAGWRPAQGTVHHGVSEELAARRLAWFYSDGGRYLDDPLTRTLAETSGRPRALRRDDVVSGRSWRRSAQFNELDRVVDSGPRMVVGLPLGSAVEAFYGVDRGLGDRSFSGREQALACAGIEAAGWLLARHARSLGVLGARTPLTPRERATVLLLLGPAAEKQIAAELGLTTRSLHQVVIAVYRKLGVCSRLELGAHIR